MIRDDLCEENKRRVHPHLYQHLRLQYRKMTIALKTPTIALPQANNTTDSRQTSASQKNSLAQMMSLKLGLLHQCQAVRRVRMRLGKMSKNGLRNTCATNFHAQSLAVLPQYSTSRGTLCKNSLNRIRHHLLLRHQSHQRCHIQPQSAYILVATRS